MKDSKVDIEERWSLDDLLAAHVYLDFIEDAEAEALAETRSRRGG